MSYDLSNPIYDHIHPTLAALARKLVMRLNDEGITFEIFAGLRAPEYQHSLFVKGRELRNGVWVVVDKRKVVTNADSWHSWHEFGLAVDIVLDGSDKPGLQPSWIEFKDVNKDGINDWLTLGVYGMELGLVWGGQHKPDGTPIFGFIDAPHMQMNRGMTTAQARQLVLADNGGLKKLWDQVEKAA